MEDKYFSSTFERKLIYIFRINDAAHKGYLKIGDATIKSKKTNEELFDNCHDLNYAAKKRINSYTSEAGIAYELLHTELAIKEEKGEGLFENVGNGKVKAFRDYQVHQVLKRSGINNYFFDTDNRQNEWFKVDLETAIKAIKCVKSNQSALDPSQISFDRDPIVFRPEQKQAIEKTLKVFKKSNRMLWNAKMRFGKTLSALQVVKQLGCRRTLIATHRPVVDEGWYEDFGKIFYDTDLFVYGSKNKGRNLKELENSRLNYVYFTSIQDLRGSDAVGGPHIKNELLFSLNWDLVIVDEAHEGTQTELGKNVFELIIKADSDKPAKVLELSGTPFNLLTNYNIDNIYTWDYIMEQESKERWYIDHFGDSNPYEELPRMNIYTYNLAEKYRYEELEDKAFNFKEFFRTWTGNTKKDGGEIPNGFELGDFVHDDDINSFLNLLCATDTDDNYPFSKDDYREYFNHTLWVVPGIKEGAALSKKLKKHPVFSQFEIVNVAGDGDADVENKNALKMVNHAITDHPESTRTITITCDKLTTGVTVPAWTAVLMLAGTYSTTASHYLQTIFRVQSPANINGFIKDNCYVFDFAPDRTLKMVADAVQYSSRSSGKSDEKQLANFLNYCPVISVRGSSMMEFSVNYLLQELKKAYAERVVRHGFDDPKIYNDQLLKLTDLELREFDNLKKVIGSSKPSKKMKDININSQGFEQAELEGFEDVYKKPARELTEEEIKAKEEYKKKKKNRDAAISILRGISIRMPLLLYGIDKDVDVDITIDSFAEQIDHDSWVEFMPEGVDKKLFKQFSKYYDKDVFIAAARRIRESSKNADELEPTERVKEIGLIFSAFRNPDKETVLTPWRVVNMHMSDCVGGYCFYDDSFQEMIEEPRYIDIPGVTKAIFSHDKAKVLEINSKSGLYPLYVTYSFYKERVKDIETKLSFEEKQKIWDEVVSKNVFVVCKTPMAKSVTQRTLVGYRDRKTNLHYFEDLINQLKNESKLDNFIWKMKRGKSYWKTEGEGDDMNFDAIVGNPPYQLQGGSGGNNDSPTYQYFVQAVNKINPDYSSLIMPARWFSAGRENLLGSFRTEMINNRHIRKMVVYPNGSDVFDNVEIKGGVLYYLIDSKYNGDCEYTIVENGNRTTVSRKLNDHDVLIRDPKKSEIIKLISSQSGGKTGTMDQLFSADTPFGIGSNVKDSKKSSIELSEEKNDEFNVALLFVEQQKRKIAYVRENDIHKNREDVYKYKVFVPESGGSGNDPYVLGKPQLGNQYSACSQTFLYVPFETEEEAKNFIKYVKTKFFRFVVSSIKISQSAPNRVYKYVPIQDFTNASDIDWNNDISSIDKQLYKKYLLQDDDINYIENNIYYFE